MQLLSVELFLHALYFLAGFESIKMNKNKQLANISECFNNHYPHRIEAGRSMAGRRRSA